MDDKDKKPDPSSSDAAKKKPEQPVGDPAPGAEMEKENRELKAKVAELQKRIQELEAEQKAAAAKARASKLIGKLEKQGMDFGDERDSELKRLAELSDDAFSATEAAYEKMAKTHAAESPPEKEPATKKAKASEDSPLRTTAGVRPHDVDDRKLSLEDRLKNGFMAAYNNRAWATKPPPINNPQTQGKSICHLLIQLTPASRMATAIYRATVKSASLWP